MQVTVRSCEDGPAATMHPYRETHARVDRPPSPSSEELILYSLLVMIGAIPIAIAVIERAMFDADATLGLMMVCTGVIGAVRQLRRRAALERYHQALPRSAPAGR